MGRIMAGRFALTTLVTTGILLLTLCLSEANSTFLLEEDLTKDAVDEYDYSEDDAGSHGTEKTRSGLCVPDCSRDGAIRLDRTSCSHYFVCSLQHQHLVLLRCTCPPHAPVFNRYRQKCSKRARCRISCSSHDLLFATWDPVIYEGLQCQAAPLHHHTPATIPIISALTPTATPAATPSTISASYTTPTITLTVPANTTTTTTTTSYPTSSITTNTILTTTSDTATITNTAASANAATNATTTPSPTTSTNGSTTNTTTITTTNTSNSSTNTNVTVPINALSTTTTTLAVVPPFLDTTTTIITSSPASIPTHFPVTATISVPFSGIMPATVTKPPDSIASPTATLPLNAISDIISTFPAAFNNIDTAWLTVPSTITTLSIDTTTTSAYTITPGTLPTTYITTIKPPLTPTASTIPETVPIISIPSPASTTPVSVSLNCNTIQCMSINSRLQDKYNCSKYYKCILQEGRLVARPYICPNAMPVFSHFLQLCITGIKCHAPCLTTTEVADVIEVLAGNVGNVTTHPETSVRPLSTDFTTDFPMTSELFADTTASPEMAAGFTLMPTDTTDEVITSKNVTDVTALFEMSTLVPISSEKPIIIPISSDTPMVIPASTNAPDVSITDISLVGPPSSDTTSFVPTSTTPGIILTSNTTETSFGPFIIPVITAATLTDNEILFETSTSASSTDTVSAISETTTGVSISTKMTDAATNPTEPRPHVSEEATTFPGMPEVTQVTAAPGWERTCELSCPAPDVKVGDPRDCHYYFICRFTDNLMPRPIRVKCPLRQPVFSAGVGVCVERSPCLAKCPASADLIFLPPSQPTSSSPLITFSISTPATYTSLFPYPTNFDIATNTTTDTSSSDKTLATGATTSGSTITTNLPADCNPTCLVADSWLADPTDCHFFYVCHFISDVIARPRRIRCPTNRPIFNQELGRCTAEGRCVTSCKHLTSSGEMNISPAVLDTPNCHPTCVLPNSRMSDPTDCYYYYICVILDSLSPRAVRTKCPQSRPFFDSRRKVCVAEAECIITCSQPNSTAALTTVSSLAADACNPVCLKLETVVADPRDCNHYYICSATDSIIISPTRMRCPSHLPVFDQSTSSCSRDAHCVVTCQSNTTTITTTTTQASTTFSLSNIVNNNTMITSTPINNVVSSTVGQGHRPKRCRPNCSSHNTIHHDPLDCHYYYVCMIGKGKSYLTRIQCPPRRPIFHLPTYSCQRAVPCIITCQDIIVSPSATVTSPTTEVTGSTTWNASSSTGDASPTTWDVSSSTGDTSPTTEVTSFTIWNISSSTGDTSPTTQVTGSNIWNISSSTGDNSPTTEVTGFTTWNISSSTGDASPTTEVTGSTTCDVSSSTADTRPTTEVTGSTTGDVGSIMTTTGAVSSTTTTGDVSSTTTTGDVSSTTTTGHISFTTTATGDVITNGEGGHNIDSVVRCDPMCPKAGVLVADLSNCHRYFVCVYVDSLAPRPVRATCPTITPVFDVTKRRCVAQAPCYQPCAPHLLPSTQVSPAATGPTTPDLLFPANSPIPGGSLAPSGSPESGASGEDGWCPHSGYFAKSEGCSSNTFTHCYQESEGGVSVEERCPMGLVFNTVSTYPYCVPPSHCPYDPATSTATVNATTCLHPGSFPKCRHCCPDFIHCEPSPSGHGYYPVTRRCPGGLVFNTDPRYPVCVKPHDCPSGQPHTSKCEREGNYPACPGCCRNYYHCTRDRRLQPRNCSFSLVFNPHPDYPFCVLAWNCPYHPAGSSDRYYTHLFQSPP